ncbi:NUDIX hydrolase [uncultured Brevundimonas sp.]|uniref:NUDIX hydrolase n=1 Tax=uncultured Brevundimonas sp. TaxID=213418 RepID=UPI002633AB95|nr:NUDIX hydrolase [uncultured Brevundimonas sp.]
MTKTKTDSPVRQIAALPWRQRGKEVEFLLVTSRETRRWVIAKGNRMAELDDPQAAAQEAYEEAGVQGDIAARPVGHYRYDKRMKDGRAVPCVVDVYPLEVLIQLGSWPEFEQRTRKWMSRDEAASAVHEPDLASLLRSFKS